MLSSRQLAKAPWSQKAIGLAAASYLRLVWRTTRFITEPADAVEQVVKHAPVIVAMWHGQHFLMPFLRPPDLQVKVLVSRHRDGEINAIAAERLGVETIRGSGTHGSDFSRKGGITAFNEIVAALKAGYSVALTADVPKVARVAGLGIVKIAQASGCPIYPITGIVPSSTCHSAAAARWRALPSMCRPAPTPPRSNLRARPSRRR
jgi:lysophospholipid acyltransferase (LPLAT)-like uncharacterized protein